MLDVAVTLVYLVTTGLNNTFIPFQKGNNELQINLEDATLQRSSFNETSGRRHAVRTVIKAMMAQLRPPVLLVLPGSHGHATNRVPWPSVLWAATGWWLM